MSTAALLGVTSPASASGGASFTTSAAACASIDPGTYVGVCITLPDGGQTWLGSYRDPLDGRVFVCIDYLYSSQLGAYSVSTSSGLVNTAGRVVPDTSVRALAYVDSKYAPSGSSGDPLTDAAIGYIARAVMGDGYVSRTPLAVTASLPDTSWRLPVAIYARARQLWNDARAHFGPYPLTLTGLPRTGVAGATYTATATVTGSPQASGSAQPIPGVRVTTATVGRLRVVSGNGALTNATGQVVLRVRATAKGSGTLTATAPSLPGVYAKVEIPVGWQTNAPGETAGQRGLIATMADATASATETITRIKPAPVVQKPSAKHRRRPKNAAPHKRAVASPSSPTHPRASHRPPGSSAHTSRALHHRLRERHGRAELAALLAELRRHEGHRRGAATEKSDPWRLCYDHPFAPFQCSFDGRDGAEHLHKLHPPYVPKHLAVPDEEPRFSRFLKKVGSCEGLRYLGWAVNLAAAGFVVRDDRRKGKSLRYSLADAGATAGAGALGAGLAEIFIASFAVGPEGPLLLAAAIVGTLLASSLFSYFVHSRFPAFAHWASRTFKSIKQRVDRVWSRTSSVARLARRGTTTAAHAARRGATGYVHRTVDDVRHVATAAWQGVRHVARHTRSIVQAVGRGVGHGFHAITQFAGSGGHSIGHAISRGVRAVRRGIGHGIHKLRGAAGTATHWAVSHLGW